MQFQNCGAVYGGGCGTPAMTRKSKHLHAAYELVLAI